MTRWIVRPGRYVIWRFTHMQVRVALFVVLCGPGLAVAIVPTLVEGRVRDALIQGALVFAASVVFLAPFVSHRLLLRRARRGNLMNPNLALDDSHVDRREVWEKESFDPRPPWDR